MIINIYYVIEYFNYQCLLLYRLYIPFWAPKQLENLFTPDVYAASAHCCLYDEFQFFFRKEKAILGRPKAAQGI